MSSCWWGLVCRGNGFSDPELSSLSTRPICKQCFESMNMNEIDFKLLQFPPHCQWGLACRGNGFSDPELSSLSTRPICKQCYHSNDYFRI